MFLFLHFSLFVQGVDGEPNEVSCSGSLCDGAVVWQNGNAFQSGSIPDSLEVTDQDDSDLVWVLLFNYCLSAAEPPGPIARWALLLATV